MEKDVRIPAIRLRQNKVEMFLCAPRCGDLLDRCSIDEWDPKFEEAGKSQEEVLKRQGYQRKPSASRIRSVAKYVISPEAVFPTNILLSAREPLKFVPYGEAEMIGNLLIRSDQRLYIIDGQHRYAGLEHAIIELGVEEMMQFQVPVAICSGLKKQDEIKQFLVVNKTQKKVPTNLGDRLLEYLNRVGAGFLGSKVLEQKDWKGRAVRIAERLNKDKSTVWAGRIVKPNADRTEIAVAGESEFTKSLKNILLSVYGQEPDEKVYFYITTYWEAIRKIMPVAFESPSEYVIQKTAGFHSWNQVMPVVIREWKDKFAQKERDARTIVSMSEIIRRVDEERLDAEWWKSGNLEGAASYVGMGPIGELANELKENIETNV